MQFPAIETKAVSSLRVMENQVMNARREADNGRTKRGVL